MFVIKSYVIHAGLIPPLCKHCGSSSGKETYESAEVARYYCLLEGLQKPEQTVMHLLELVLRDGRGLDIGVGGGRTTQALSAIAREYVGIDYSASMIDARLLRFPTEVRPLSFLVSDVRDMHEFADQTFDAVVFFYNGLDNMPYEDRLVALREIRRGCRLGRAFVFSFHNLQHARQIFSYLAVLSERTPGSLLRGILKTSRLRALNPEFQLLLKEKWAILNDGAHKGRLRTYYVRPSYQIEQLQATGFAHVRTYSLVDGTEIHDITELDRSSDP